MFNIFGIKKKLLDLYNTKFFLGIVFGFLIEINTDNDIIDANNPVEIRSIGDTI